MPLRSSRPPRILVAAAAAVLVLLLGIWIGGHPSWLPSGLRSALVDNNDGRLVQEALDVLARDYYRPIDRSALVDKGLAVAIGSLNDPYSHYFDRAEYHAFLAQTNPHLSGVGIDVVPNPRGLLIEGVFPDSPAARAGLHTGEEIVAVGSTSLANRARDFATGLIQGRAGTRVRLTIVNGSRRRAVTITRANLVAPAASARLVSYGAVKIGDLQLTSFTQGSGTELRTQVDRMLGSGARALILDLRGNGGGLLEEGVNVASIFIPDGTIVSTAGRSQPRQVYVAKGGAISTKIPLVVLVDRGTASSSEIVTAALQDRGRAKVVGTHTYGKGVFQQLETLSNGGALDITVGEYFTPSGRTLGGGGVRQGAGVQPNLYAAGNPRSRGDHALAVAERTVAAQAR
jgi:carboxyl-terminal processing protease